MAIFHCSIKIISRGGGKSAVAAAAYRAGEKITNEYDGVIHDYTRNITHAITPIRKKLDEINDNEKRYEAYKKHKYQHDQYQKDLSAQKPWKKKAYEREYGWVVGVFESAKDNVDGLRNESGKFPVGAWGRERKRLAAKIQSLNSKYQHLKAEVDDVHKIRTKVYDVLRKERQRGQPVQVKTQDMER